LANSSAAINPPCASFSGISRAAMRPPPMTSLRRRSCAPTAGWRVFAATRVFPPGSSASRNARRRQREHASLDHPIAAVAQSTQPASDLRHDLAFALRHLSDDEQLAIHLGYQQGKSHSEIAALLDWPLGTVKTHLARGKEKLRQHLSAWNPQT
jgi:RNA polymerase sigma factor (sigma-70 family)